MLIPCPGSEHLDPGLRSILSHRILKNVRQPLLPVKIFQEQAICQASAMNA